MYSKINARFPAKIKSTYHNNNNNRKMNKHNNKYI